MPVSLHMTWVPAGRRWMKKHNGKWYAIRCRKLGVPPTKEASWRAANEWWEAKLREIDSTPPTEEDLRANAFRVWSMVQDWQQLDEPSRERLVDSLTGAGQYQRINTAFNSDTDTAVTGTFSEADEPNTTLTLDFYTNPAPDPTPDANGFPGYG